MALKIAKDSGLTDLVSAGNPITTQHPISGSQVTVQLWLFNDDNTKYYTGITIDPTDATETDESGWIELSNDGTTWQAAGASLSFADIGSAGTPDTTGKTFYARVTTPSVADTQNKSDIKLTVNGTEFAV